MAVLCKIFVAFEDRFWDDKESIFVADEHLENKFPFWKPIYAEDGNKTNVLMTVVIGDQARRVERLELK